MRKHTRSGYVPFASAAALLTAVLAGLGGCGGPQAPVGQAHDTEVRGLGGPAKPPWEMAARSVTDGPRSVAEPLDQGDISDTVPDGEVNWHSFTARDAAFQIVTIKREMNRGDPDLYVLGAVGPRSDPGSLRLLGQSCRWWDLTDWVAVRRADVEPGSKCYVAVHGYGAGGRANPYRAQYDVSRGLAEGVAARGELAEVGACAWLHFTPATAGEYLVSVEPLSGDPDLFVYVGDSSGCIGWSARTGVREQVQFRAVGGDTLFARVQAYEPGTRFRVKWRRYSVESPGPPSGAAERIMVVGWDGVQRAHLEEMLAGGQLPSLAAMVAGGSRVATLVRGHSTVTKPGWVEIFTGYTASVTGTLSNLIFRPMPEGMTILERAQDYLALQGKPLATLVVTSKDSAIGSRPGEPWELTAPRLTVWDGDVERDASVSGPLMLGYLDQYAAGPFLAFFHFRDPDWNGHGYGENSEQYSQAIATCDAWLGTLKDKLAELGVSDLTRVFVATDHGFDEGADTHARAPDAWLVSDRPDLVRNGLQIDVCPTLYDAMGIPYDSMGYDPPLPGRPLSQP
jgi:Type I phosphodiesterase / nucleotide pyrophosphatase